MSISHLRPSFASTSVEKITEDVIGKDLATTYQDIPSSFKRRKIRKHPIKWLLSRIIGRKSFKDSVYQKYKDFHSHINSISAKPLLNTPNEKASLANKKLSTPLSKPPVSTTATSDKRSEVIKTEDEQYMASKQLDAALPEPPVSTTATSEKMSEAIQTKNEKITASVSRSNSSANNNSIALTADQQLNQAGITIGEEKVESIEEQKNKVLLQLLKAEGYAHPDAYKFLTKTLLVNEGLLTVASGNCWDDTATYNFNTNKFTLENVKTIANKITKILKDHVKSLTNTGIYKEPKPVRESSLPVKERTPSEKKREIFQCYLNDRKTIDGSLDRMRAGRNIASYLHKQVNVKDSQDTQGDKKLRTFSYQEVEKIMNQYNKLVSKGNSSYTATSHDLKNKIKSNIASVKEITETKNGIKTVIDEVNKGDSSVFYFIGEDDAIDKAKKKMKRNIASVKEITETKNNIKTVIDEVTKGDSSVFYFIGEDDPIVKAKKKEITQSFIAHLQEGKKRILE
ncbi:MAG: hypothetical protein PUP46_05085 [Endozoicomonas sp. (ex Botrylloides leachii)]|nr:hypothetical protein [Endozoicomonas sp. (ex Botrylloides leachii)]